MTHNHAYEEISPTLGFPCPHPRCPSNNGRVVICPAEPLPVPPFRGNVPLQPVRIRVRLFKAEKYLPVGRTREAWAWVDRTPPEETTP